MITEIEFQEWKENAVTQKFLSALKIEREAMKEGLIRNLYSDPASIIGKAEAVQDILEMKYEDLVEVIRSEHGK